MFTVAFWKSAGERSAKSAAQALLLTWGGDQVFDLFSISPLGALGIAGGAVVLSVLTSVVSAPVSDSGTPSLVRDGS